MDAEHIVTTILDAEEIDPEAELKRFSPEAFFDRGAADILDEARQLFLRLQADGTIDTLLHKGSKGRLTTYDESSVAQAIIRRAIERRGSLGADRAYKAIKRLNYYNF